MSTITTGTAAPAAGEAPSSLASTATATAAADKQPRVALRRAVSLRHEARSAKTFWLSRMRDVTLEVALDGLTVVESAPAQAAASAASSSASPRKREHVAWQDVLGAHILNEDSEHVRQPVELAAVATGKTYVFAVFAYPPKRARAGKLKKRQLREWLFRFPGAEMADVLGLLTWVNYLADPRSADAVARAASLDALAPVARANRKFLVIINPVGGAGKAVPTYESKVAPLFKYANIDAEVRLTERAAHGVELAETLPLGVYDCVVTVGGDGSLCEIFQGLMKRADWKDAIRQPLGVIPGGSGNGLFSSLMHELGERFKPASAGFVLAKGLPHPLDLTAVRNPHGEHMYSFLSTEWAFIADVDVESEKLRALGGARFAVKTVQNLFFSKKDYEGEVWYLEEEDAANETPPVPHEVSAGAGAQRPGFELFDGLADGAPAPDGSAAKWKRLAGNFQLVWAMNLTHAASDALLAPGAALNDGYNYLVVMDGARPRKDLISAFLGIENGKHVEVDGVQFIKTRAYKIAPARPDDLICVDGEVFKGPVDAQVHHNVARMITLPRATSCHP